MCPATRFLATLMALLGDAIIDEIECAVMTHIVGKLTIQIAGGRRRLAAEGDPCRDGYAATAHQHASRHHRICGRQMNLRTDRRARQPLRRQRWPLATGLT